MPDQYGYVRSERKKIVGSITEPYLISKKDRTLKQQYERISPGPDGYIRTTLSSVGTETSRLSSSESFVDPASTNLQNISKSEGFRDNLYRVRDVIVADPGMSFWANDYDKAEAVCAAVYSKDWDFYHKLIEGEDIHTWHAAHFFGHDSEDQVTKIQRQVAKMITYASNYKINDFTLMRKLNEKADQTGVKLTQDQAGELKRAYLDLHPLEEWWASVEKELTSRGYIVNAFGLKRVFYNPNEHKRLKEALAYLPQSTVACAINESMIRIYNELDQTGQTQLLLQVHDELMGQAPTERVEEISLEVQRIMETPFEVHGREVYIPAGRSIGRRWGTYRDKKTDPDNNMERLEEQ